VLETFEFEPQELFSRVMKTLDLESQELLFHSKHEFGNNSNDCPKM
jgi:hypothetical protein